MLCISSMFFFLLQSMQLESDTQKKHSQVEKYEIALTLTIINKQLKHLVTGYEL